MLDGHLLFTANVVRPRLRVCLLVYLRFLHSCIHDDEATVCLHACCASLLLFKSCRLLLLLLLLLTLVVAILTSRLLQKACNND